MLIWFLQNNKGVIFRSLEKVLNLHAELKDLCKTCTLKMYATCDRHNSALYWNCLNDVQNIIAQIKKSCILHCAAFFFFSLCLRVAQYWELLQQGAVPRQPPHSQGSFVPWEQEGLSALLPAWAAASSHTWPQLEVMRWEVLSAWKVISPKVHLSKEGQPTCVKHAV